MDTPGPDSHERNRAANSRMRVINVRLVRRGCGGVLVRHGGLRRAPPHDEEGGELPPADAGCASEFCQNFVKISSNFSKISINFCIQYSIFQHFSKSTHFCKILQKILQNSAKFLRISDSCSEYAPSPGTGCPWKFYVAGGQVEGSFILRWRERLVTRSLITKFLKLWCFGSISPFLRYFKIWDKLHETFAPPGIQNTSSLLPWCRRIGVM